MSVGIDWGAFVQVFLAALIGACAVVTFYAFGLRPVSYTHLTLPTKA